MRMHAMLVAAVTAAIAMRTESVGIDFKFSDGPTDGTILRALAQSPGVQDVRTLGHYHGTRFMYRLNGQKFTVTFYHRSDYLQIQGKPPCILAEARRLQSMLGGRLRERSASDEGEETSGATSSHEAPTDAATQQTSQPATSTAAASTPTARTPTATTGPRPTGTTPAQGTAVGRIVSAVPTFFSGPPTENSYTLYGDDDDVVTSDGVMIVSTTTPIEQRPSTLAETIDWINGIDDPAELRAIAVQSVRLTAQLEEQVAALTRRMNALDMTQP